MVDTSRDCDSDNRELHQADGEQQANLADDLGRCDINVLHEAFKEILHSRNRNGRRPCHRIRQRAQYREAGPESELAYSPGDDDSYDVSRRMQDQALGDDGDDTGNLLGRAHFADEQSGKADFATSETEDFATNYDDYEYSDDRLRPDVEYHEQGDHEESDGDAQDEHENPEHYEDADYEGIERYAEW